MILVGTFGQEVGSSPIAVVKSIVFVVDDDVWVRESLESLIRDEGWQPETFATAQEFLDHPRALLRVVGDENDRHVAAFDGHPLLQFETVNAGEGNVEYDASPGTKLLRSRHDIRLRGVSDA